MTTDITKYLENESVPEFVLANKLFYDDELENKYKTLVDSLKPYQEQKNLEINLTEDDVRYALNKGLEKAISTLTDKEQGIILDRNSLNKEKKKYTLDEIGKKLVVTKERVRQIEAKGLRKLNHPVRLRGILNYFNESILEKIGEKNPSLFRSLYYNLDAVKGRNNYLEEQVKELQGKIKAIVMQYKENVNNILGDETVKTIYEEKQKEEILNTSIEELDLSVRAYNCVRNGDIRTLRDLTNKTEIDLLRTKNFGRKGLNEIKEILAEKGLILKER